jgi:hypothetical protein
VRSPERCCLALAATVLLVALSGTAHAAAPHAATVPAGNAPPAEGPVTRDEVRAAVATLAADPNLRGEKKLRELRWTHSESPQPANTPSPSWAGGFFDFLAQGLRVILWTLGLAAAAFAAVLAIRWLRALPPLVEPDPPAPVKSISGMDIRPASLPEDIGGAALTLAHAGRTRDALSLLYRGALSRAVHRYGAAIGEAFTEGEALRAVNARLDPTKAAYVANLVGIWQRTVYAGQSAGRETVEALCQGFAPALDGAPP